MTDDTATAQLKSLVRGLWFPSETEAPWTVPTWTLDDLSPAAIRQALRREPDAPVATGTLPDLLDQVQKRCRGYGDEGTAITQQHQALVTFLQDHCDAVHVFRIGEVTIDILLIGETSDAPLILQTQSVET